jgi:hypothetical protein
MRPDEPSVAAQHVELALAAARQRILGHHEIGGSRVGRPRALLERNLVGGVRSADRGEIFGQGLDELPLAERIGARRVVLGGSARHLLDDADPIFLGALEVERPLQGVTIAALGEQHLLLIGAGKAGDDLGSGRILVGKRLCLEGEVERRGLAFGDCDLLRGALEIRQLDCDRIGARREVRPARKRIFAFGVGVDRNRDRAVVAMRLDGNPRQGFAGCRDDLAGHERGAIGGKRGAAGHERRLRQGNSRERNSNIGFHRGDPSVMRRGRRPRLRVLVLEFEMIRLACRPFNSRNVDRPEHGRCASSFVRWLPMPTLALRTKTGSRSPCVALRAALMRGRATASKSSR